jgi:hypothetical protein
MEETTSFKILQTIKGRVPREVYTTLDWFFSPTDNDYYSFVVSRDGYSILRDGRRIKRLQGILDSSWSFFSRFRDSLINN